MKVEVKIPAVGWTMLEGKIISWLKKKNDPVKNGEVLCLIETDKATIELPSPADGILSEVLAEEGSSVPVGETIAVITGG